MFETKKEILVTFKKIKKCIKENKNDQSYKSYIGETILSKKIWWALSKLHKIHSISDAGKIIEKFYNIELDNYFRTKEWEDKMLKLYDICDSKCLEIE